jgi:hypothetical protein
MKNTSTDSPTESPAPKPPIYPVSVIEVACRALEAIAEASEHAERIDLSDTSSELLGEALDIAVRIIRDGLASHERAIKGEP